MTIHKVAKHPVTNISSGWQMYKVWSEGVKEFLQTIVDVEILYFNMMIDIYVDSQPAGLSYNNSVVRR